jgi:hypothetical protein
VYGTIERWLLVCVYGTIERWLLVSGMWDSVLSGGWWWSSAKAVTHDLQEKGSVRSMMPADVSDEQDGKKAQAFYTHMHTHNPQPQSPPPTHTPHKTQGGWQRPWRRMHRSPGLPSTFTRAAASAAAAVLLLLVPVPAAAAAITASSSASPGTLRCGRSTHKVRESRPQSAMARRAVRFDRIHRLPIPPTTTTSHQQAASPTSPAP